MADDARLRIRGPGADAALSRTELLALPDQIPDIAALVPKRTGAAVPLSSVLAAAGPAADAQFVTFMCDDVWFAACVPLAAVGDAIVVHSLDGAALPRDKGGPFRLLIPGAAKCHTAEIDTCANVKHLAEITLSADRGTDTRPDSSTSHAELHERE